MGPDRGKRIRRCRDASPGRAFPARPAAFSGAHAARQSRPRGYRARPCERRVCCHAADQYRDCIESGGLPSTPAMAYCQGTPLRNEIEARVPALLDEATELAAKAIAEKFGSGPVEGKMQAHVFSIKK